MVKLIAMIKRKEGMTREEFSRYWEEKHGPLIVKLFPGMKRYVQNHAVRLPGGGEPQFDGMVEVWFDDLQSWRAVANFSQSDEGKVLRDDEEKFIDRSKIVFLVAEERVIKQ